MDLQVYYNTREHALYHYHHDHMPIGYQALKLGEKVTDISSFRQARIQINYLALRKEA
jgi:hypothetical protein